MRIARTWSVTLLALFTAVTVSACSSATPAGPANAAAVAAAITAAESAAPGSVAAEEDSTTAVSDATAADPDSASDDPDPDSDDDVTTEPQTGPPLVAGPVMPGTNLPIPQGMDCSGSNTTKGEENRLLCASEVNNATAFYNYFLTALPKAGFVIGSTAYQGQGADLSAAIYFNSSQFNGLDAITFAGDEVDISLQKL